MKKSELFSKFSFDEAKKVADSINNQIIKTKVYLLKMDSCLLDDKVGIDKLKVELVVLIQRLEVKLIDLNDYIDTQESKLQNQFMDAIIMEKAPFVRYIRESLCITDGALLCINCPAIAPLRSNQFLNMLYVEGSSFLALAVPVALLGMGFVQLLKYKRRIKQFQNIIKVTKKCIAQLQNLKKNI